MWLWYLTVEDFTRESLAKDVGPERHLFAWVIARMAGVEQSFVEQDKSQILVRQECLSDGAPRVLQLWLSCYAPSA